LIWSNAPERALATLKPKGMADGNIRMDAFRRFLGSKWGLTASILVAVLGIYLVVTHTGHAVGALPYLLLLFCPLLHLFGHDRDHSRATMPAESEHNP
jgi:hypothetical protein